MRPFFENNNCFTFTDASISKVQGFTCYDISSPKPEISNKSYKSRLTPHFLYVSLDF
jgi:hypothetical protein